MSLRDHLTRYADAPVDWNPSWVIRYFWQKNAVNYLCGPPKAARKSTLRRYLTACAISGYSPFGLVPVEQRVTRVLSMLIEDHPGRERKTIDTILRTVGHEAAPHVDFLIPYGFHLNVERHVSELVKLVQEEGYDLITIDPLIEFHNADENSANEMAEVNVSLRRLAELATVLVTHHTAKPPVDGPSRFRTVGESMRGSSAIGGAADTMVRSQKTGAGRVKLELEGKEIPDEFASYEVEIDQHTFLWTPATPLTEDGVLALVMERPGVTREDLQQMTSRRKGQVLSIVKTLLSRQMLVEEKNGKEPGRLFVGSGAP